MGSPGTVGWTLRWASPLRKKLRWQSLVLNHGAAPSHLLQDRGDFEPPCSHASESFHGSRDLICLVLCCVQLDAISR